MAQVTRLRKRLNTSLKILIRRLMKKKLRRLLRLRPLQRLRRRLLPRLKKRLPPLLRRRRKLLPKQLRKRLPRKLKKKLLLRLLRKKLLLLRLRPQRPLKQRLPLLKKLRRRSARSQTLKSQLMSLLMNQRMRTMTMTQAIIRRRSTVANGEGSYNQLMELIVHQVTIFISRLTNRVQEQELMEEPLFQAPVNFISNRSEGLATLVVLAITFKLTIPIRAPERTLLQERIRTTPM